MSELAADLAVQRGEFHLDVRLRVAAGEVLAVLGPNGAGKSTLLGALTGQLRPQRAAISLGGTDIAELAMHRRRIGVLGQEPLLFPHLSVLANVAFGPRAAGMPRGKAHSLAHELLGEVDAGEFAARKPAAISGGQAQRVALARALAARPELLLLDEPFSALDVDSAPRVRALIGRVLAEHPETASILVTHDPLDALVLADRVAVLDGGRIVEQGPAREVLSAPSTPFAARIAGLNLVTGTVTEHGLDGLSGILAAEARIGAAGAAVFAPSAVAAFRERPDGSPRNVVPAELAHVERAGDLVRLRLRASDGGPGWVDGLRADITPAALADLDLQPGGLLWLAVKATEIVVHPQRAAR
ncbi:sulfate/molybdate ABC transporter ATP-binding protein [Sciscionella marina]|uniref:sulfate/molybdate ABC transporter ATP-binding protein n=1 Tax=Sciscionella marina TaxID=508770 RepID=UPI00037464B8|nr:ABC transporter ATP-binding protein [Sciscionella marina]